MTLAVPKPSGQPVITAQARIADFTVDQFGGRAHVFSLDRRTAGMPQTCPHGRTFGASCEPCGRRVS